MDVTPLVKDGQQIIQSYAGGAFRISGERYESAVIVFPDSSEAWNFSGGFSELNVEAFGPLVAQADEIDVVLLGCGPEIAFLPDALRAELKAQGISVDVMDTSAACRTYNVLMAEGRRVVAALLPS